LAALLCPIFKCILTLGHCFAAIFAAILILLLFGFGGKNHAHGAGRRTIDEGCKTVTTGYPFYAGIKTAPAISHRRNKRIMILT
jgi:hypothetical protein